MRNRKSGRARPFRAVFWSVVLFGGIICTALIFHPDSMLPREWNPTKRLAVADPVTPLTAWKLRQAIADPAQCVSILEEVADISVSEPYSGSNEACYITTPVDLRRVGNARMSGVQTDCATALRLAMWEHHTLQPKARLQMGTDVAVLNDVGSYNCRAMRTSSGETGRWSSHATASAIDITGFQFGDGTRISLINDWNDSDNAATFLRAARDGACKWFPLTLSPDYNTLHADHFHLQASGWRLCR